jgi:hypothetical protein
MLVKTQIKWNGAEDCTAMKQHLTPHGINKDIALRAIYGAATPEQRVRIQISAKCGTSPSDSYFIFIEGAGSTSQIVGVCDSNRMDHLLQDFDHLISQMKLSGIDFKEEDTYIQTNDERFTKKSLHNFVLERTILLNLLSLTGIIPLISSYLLKKEALLSLDISAFLAVPMGFILWLVIVCIGYVRAPEYALE